MRSKEALETVKDYLLPKLKEDNSELGSIIIVESVNVLEELVEQAQKQEKLLIQIKDIINRPHDISSMLEESKRYVEIEKLIKELENE